MCTRAIHENSHSFETWRVAEQTDLMDDGMQASSSTASTPRQICLFVRTATKLEAAGHSKTKTDSAVVRFRPSSCMTEFPALSSSHGRRKCRVRAVIGPVWTLVQKFRGWRVDESTGPNVEMPVSTEATYASFGKLHLPAH